MLQTKNAGHYYTRRHNEVLRCIHLFLLNKYGLGIKRRIRTHSVKEYVTNEFVEIRVDSTIKTDILIHHNRPDIFIWDKKMNVITLIEIGITNPDSINILRMRNLENKIY